MATGGAISTFGDSILRNMLEDTTSLKRQFKNGKWYIGNCVGGQTIENLQHSIGRLSNTYGTNKKAIVMIGTNDILRGRGGTGLITSLVDAVNVLRTKNFRVILVCTLPPIPKSTADQRTALDQYNGSIRRVFRQDTIDVHDALVLASGVVDARLFSRDRLHPNAEGSFKIYQLVMQHAVVSLGSNNASTSASTASVV